MGQNPIPRRGEWGVVLSGAHRARGAHRHVLLPTPHSPRSLERMPVQAIAWTPSGAVRIVDQRALPEAHIERDLESVAAMAEAIRTLQVRGAPLIGIAAAMGLVAGLRDERGAPRERFLARVEELAAPLAAARPTTVNLRWALDRMRRVAAQAPGDGAALWDRLKSEATAIWEEDRAMCRRIGEAGLALVPDGATVLTHCNAGALATGGIGTALAPVYLAHEAGRRVRVYVDETRPVLQGARLTAWELTHAGIPCTVIADAAAGALMRQAGGDPVLGGAGPLPPDRHFADKIGTYAVLGLDQGTTGTTALVVAEDGRVLGRGYREFTQHFPAPGEVEHDAEEIFRITLAAAREALQQAQVVPAALGITNQRETVCVWERDTGRPLHRAIVWQDRRTAARCRELVKQRRTALVRERTGLVIDPYFSATKIEWLLTNVPGLPVAGSAGDQQAALFGQGCVEPGQAKNTYGTGAFLLLNTGRERAVSKHGLLTTLACGARGEPVYALEGSVFIAGAAVQWLRDGLRIIRHAAETEQLAREVSDTGGLSFVPAFVGLGAPHWEPHARGTIVGITRGTTRAHLARAALEAMAFSTKDVLKAMTGDAKLQLHALQVDGGAAANDWLMQFQADLLGVPVVRPDVVETTALGAAALAGLGVGVWRSPQEFLAGRKFRRFLPGDGAPGARAREAEWRRAVETALHWAAAGSR